MTMDESNINKLRELTKSLTLRDKELLERHKVFTHILDQSTDGYWDWDLVTGNEFLSENFKMQLGFEDHEMENIPDAWMKYCDPDDLGRMQIKMQEHFDSRGTTNFMTEARFTHKNGSDVWILCRGAVIEWDEDFKPLRMVGTHTDITECAMKMIQRLNGGK